MRLPIRFYGDPVLREQTRPVAGISGDLATLAEDMLETMRAEQGVGLAAPQVGRGESLCVVEVPAAMDEDEDGARLHPDIAMPMVLVNPVVTGSTEDTWSMEEGCLSFPGIVGQIRRPLGVTVDYLDLAGTAVTRSLSGFLARVVQHEIDHLNGVLFIDRMSPVRRVALAGRLKRMQRETEGALAPA